MQIYIGGGTPGHYFSPEYFLGGATTYAILEAGAERGANVHTGKVAEKYTNIYLGAVLGAGYLSRIAADRFV